MKIIDDSLTSTTNYSKLIIRLTLYVVTVSFLAGCSDDNLAHQVNPFIGTDGPGNVYPGATVPFGMVQLSPDNGTSGWDRIAGYFYPDTTIAGFSHTHLSGTGAGDLYDISFMPAVPPFKVGSGELGLYSTFSHDKEEAYAGYYQVYLEDYDINVELTATERCGVQRYTFPKSDSAIIKLNLNKAMNWDATKSYSIKIIDSVTVQGYRFSKGWAAEQKVSFYTRFSKPFYSHDNDGTFLFTTDNNEKIVVKTAISSTLPKGAELNYIEVAGKSFEQLRDSAIGKWNMELGKIEVNGGSKDEQITFYTALYRTMLSPTLFNDLDGKYLGVDKKLYQPAHQTYSTFSLWDTYRAEHPLLTFLHPNRVSDMVSSFIDFYEQSGALPVWSMWANETDMMIGYHSVSVIAEAYLKGVPMDAEKALEAMVSSANRDEYRGIGDFKRYGFLAADKHSESVSKTIEYSYDDYCIAVMADKMGETDVATEFYDRSKGYIKLFNEESKFFEPKNYDNSWVGSFNPDAYTTHFTESNAWQYRLAAQHDINNVIELMGGKVSFEKALDTLFTHTPKYNDTLPIFSTGMIGQYVQGNEPSHHVAYLYNTVDKLSKTQSLINHIMRSQYTNTPNGLSGNEDCGQMSAWYVFSAMGFYPVDPVALKYELGIPLFKEITMQLPQNKQFKIIAKGVDKDNYTTKDILLNGTPLKRTYITWNEILSGGTLEFKL